MKRSTPLKADPEKTRAWKRRSAERAFERKREKDRHRERRRATRATGNDWPASTRRICRKRSGGWCEIHGEPCAATQLHHRKRRKERDHRPCNGLHVCDRAHRYFELHRPEAFEKGWIVSWKRDPELEPVLIVGGRKVLLTNDGQYQDVAA